MNPLDVSESIQPFQDSAVPLTTVDFQGGPIMGPVTADAITTATVNLLAAEIQKLNDFAWGDYQGLLAAWRSNNAAGIYRPAPGPVNLAAVNRAAAYTYYATGKGGEVIVSCYAKWDPAVAPGTILAPPAAPQAPEKTAESIGAQIPGTGNLFSAAGGPYEVSEIGKRVASNGSNYELISMTPMAWEPAWMRL